jgi:transposase
MERPGVSWRPVSTRLAGLLILLVVKAQPIKAVPGRKTEVKGAEGITALLRHGLLRGSFLPAKPPRQLRELTRPRTTLVQDRARVINRVQAGSEEANIKLASVVTGSRGVSARAMLEALSAGQQEVTARADLARGRRRPKRAPREGALQGYCTPHHRFLLTEDFSPMDSLDDAIARVSAVIAQRLAAEHEAIALLDTIPGASQRTAEILLAEIGPDMTRFPRAKHLASWAGMCPGHDASGGKRRSGKTRKGRRW